MPPPKHRTAQRQRGNVASRLAALLVSVLSVAALGFALHAVLSGLSVVHAQAAAGSSEPSATADTVRRRAESFLRGRSAQARSQYGANATDTPMAAEALAHARAQHLVLAAGQAAPLNTPWTAVGPLQVQTAAYGLVTGRITSVAIDPNDTSGNTVYIGTSGGGVWKSTNAAGAASAVSFQPLTDTLPVFSPNGGSAIPSLSIGALTVQPGGTGVVLAGTGDPNDATDSYYGEGLLRSTDGGTTWALVQQAASGHGFYGEAFAGFAWSTISTQTVVAALSTSAEAAIVRNNTAYGYLGLYYSQDGGATWLPSTIQDGTTLVQDRYSNITTFRGNAATSVVWNPVRQRFYAAVRSHGYYESADGITFTRMANQPGAGLTGSACPTRTGDYGLASCPIFHGALAAQPVSGDGRCQQQRRGTLAGCLQRQRRRLRFVRRAVGHADRDCGDGDERKNPAGRLQPVACGGAGGHRAQHDGYPAVCGDRGPVSLRPERRMHPAQHDQHAERLRLARGCRARAARDCVAGGPVQQQRAAHYVRQ